jgi:hypothetical protein
MARIKKTLTLDNIQDIKDLSISIIEGFYYKDALSGPEANALLAFTKFVHALNTETVENGDSDDSDTFEIQL